jgi:hypothetical protein
MAKKNNNNNKSHKDMGAQKIEKKNNKRVDRVSKAASRRRNEFGQKSY